MKALVLIINLMLIGTLANGPSETFKTDTAHSTMKIEGTSTLHDWEMKANELKGTMEVDLYDDSVDILDLELVVPVKSLKSGKSKMDNNAHDALKAEDHPKITYKFIKVTGQEKVGDRKVKLTTRGKLTVAGKSRNMDIPVYATFWDGGIELSGSVGFKMTSFDVEPPSFMLGAVTTGDDITIKFSINYN